MVAAAAAAMKKMVSELFWSFVLLLLRSFASFRVTLLGRLFSPFLGTFFKWDLIILFMYVYIFLFLFIFFQLFFF